MSREEVLPSFDDITRRWKERVGRGRAYEVVEDEGEQPDSYLEPRVYGREYERAQTLLHSLLKKYERASLPEALAGVTLHNSYGSCYHIEQEYDGFLHNFHIDRTKNILLSDLKLLYGIGEITETNLKNDGVCSISDLKSHPVWGRSAQKILRLLESEDTAKLQEWLWRWLPKSHPEALCLAGFHDMNDFVIFDIETMGIFGRPILLIGLASPQGETIVVHQYLVRELADEPAVLAQFCSHVGERTALISYNGRSFDLPYIQERLGYYGQDPLVKCPHFDILHFARREWRDNFQDCKLTTLERELIGHIRRGDVPSALVPEFYDTYLQTGNVGPLVPIIQHNRQDVITLAKIFSELCRRWGNGDW